MKFTIEITRIPGPNWFQWTVSTNSQFDKQPLGAGTSESETAAEAAAERCCQSIANPGKNTLGRRAYTYEVPAP